MPRVTDAVLLAQLKKEMCPGGAGHAGVECFKASCVLCRTTAELNAGVLKIDAPADAPVVDTNPATTLPGPGDKPRTKKR